MIKTYHDLIETLAPLDRCHAGPEMDKAYEILTSYYKGSRILSYPCGENIYHWELPPYWTCREATLTDPDGHVIASLDESRLAVFSYSPAFEGTVTLEQLKDHLFTSPNVPDAYPFHFRNQYRHRNPEWGFCLPHNRYNKLSPGEYKVKIDSQFEPKGKLSQADYVTPGSTGKEILLVGHFDHPAQVNDGLAGTVAAFEVVKRLSDVDTRFSYRAFASVEIVGSVAYLYHEADVAARLDSGLFLALAGTDSPMIYQSSFHNRSLIDRAAKNVLDPRGEKDVLFSHREKIGNDENVFDSVGYEIPMGTLLRWPFANYHTSDDNYANYKAAGTEEIIERTLEIIFILENDAKVSANFKGIPALANPEIDLYLSPTNISQTIDHTAENRFGSRLSPDILKHVTTEPDLLYHFMRITLRMLDGENTILDISEATRMPFSFTYWYICELQKKGLVELDEGNQ